jgi:MOSC domain-containing protein YiiM
MMPAVKVFSLNVARPSLQRYGDAEFFTGGVKRPVQCAMLRRENFDRDGQGDLKNHGGPEKAVCVYPYDHYPCWEEVLGRKLEPGSFGENLTVDGAVEGEVCIGDVFRVGEAVVQVCQPRMPCDKQAGKLGEKRLVKWMVEADTTGFYLRVLSEGEVRSGGAFERIESHPDHITISQANDVIYGRSGDAGLIERLAVMPEYSAVGREFCARKLGHMKR